MKTTKQQQKGTNKMKTKKIQKRSISQFVFVRINLEGLLKKYIEDKGLIKDDIDRKYWTEQFECYYKYLEDTIQPGGEQWVFEKAHTDMKPITIFTYPNYEWWSESDKEKWIASLFETHTQMVYEDSWKMSKYLTPEIYGLTPEEYREKHSCK